MTHQATFDLDPVVRPCHLADDVVERLDADMVRFQSEHTRILRQGHPSGTINSMTK